MARVGIRFRAVRLLSVLVAVGVLATVGAATAVAAPEGAADPGSIARGGRLYDTWWTEAGVAAPKGDQPLWASQTTNTATGTATWRCKECHGWDYKGKDGAYGSGSHKTGFVGVADAGKNKTAQELVAILKGTANPKHDFSTGLNDAQLGNLADFLKEGLIDVSKSVDYATKKPIGANADKGKELYASTCTACHGADGTKLNFGTAEKPEYVKTVAANPQEFMHKIRAGQPGTPMPAAITTGWPLQNVVDLLAFSQSLPQAAPAAPAAPVTQAAPVTPAALPKAGESASVPFEAGMVIVGLALASAGLVVTFSGARRKRRVQS